MPIYDYVCSHCGNTVEVMQSMSEAPLTLCAACGKEGLQKMLLSAPSFQLKGKGWYKTDYTPAGSRSSSASDDSVSAPAPAAPTDAAAT